MYSILDYLKIKYSDEKTHSAIYDAFMEAKLFEVLKKKEEEKEEKQEEAGKFVCS